MYTPLPHTGHISVPYRVDSVRGRIHTSAPYRARSVREWNKRYAVASKLPPLIMVSSALLGMAAMTGMQV